MRRFYIKFKKMSPKAKIFSVFLTLVLLLVLLSLPAQAALNDSTCAGISPPTAPVYEGYKYTASVTMTNTGDNSWSTSGGYALGSTGNTLNWGVNRVPLPSSPIATNQNATFNFEITVDASPGTYNFSWRMVRDPESTYGFFGATCTASITVLPSPYALYSPLMLKNHPSGYVPDATKVTENSPYYSSSNANEKQWSYLSVNNPGSAAVDVQVTLYRNDGTKLTNFTKNITAGNIWNAFGDTSWEPATWVPDWVSGSNDRPGTADDSVLGWAKVVPVAPAVGSAPIPVFGQQRMFIAEPKTDATTGKPVSGAIHLLTDMGLTSSPSASLYGGYFMRNWPAGYPNDSSVVQRTYINIANPNNSSANVTMKVYKTDGTLHYTLNKTVAAFGSWYSIGDSGWDGIPMMDTTNNRSLGWIEITSDKPVTGFNRTVAEKPGDTNWLRILTDFPLAPPSSSVNLYTSLYTKNHPSGFTAPGTSNQINQWSYLTLHNPGSTAANASIQVYSKTGTPATPFVKVIPAHGTWISKNDSGWNAVNIGTLGWVWVNSDVPLVGVNRVSIGGEGVPHYYWTDYPMDFLGSRALYSAYFLKDHPSGYWESGVVQRSYIQIANPSASSATVTIKVKKPDGTTHATLTKTIASKNSWVSIEDTDWTGITGLTYGWVEVTSTQPIVATNRVTFAKSGAGSTNWLRLMTDAPLTPPPPPSLGVLNVVPDTKTAIPPASVEAQAYGRTGLRGIASEGFVGSNFYNALEIKPKVINASSSTVDLIGAAFAAAPPGGGKAYIHSIEGDDAIAILKSRATSSNGFVLIYAVNNATQASGPTPGTGAGQSGCTTYNFCADKYYVYFNGGWNLSEPLIPYNRSDLGLRVMIPSDNPTPAIPPVFSATLYSTIGNHNWTTYSYYMARNGEEKSEVRNACKTSVTDIQSPNYTNPAYCF